jgi:hypothetical protein
MYTIPSSDVHVKPTSLPIYVKSYVILHTPSGQFDYKFPSNLDVFGISMKNINKEAIDMIQFVIDDCPIITWNRDELIEGQELQLKVTDNILSLSKASDHTYGFAIQWNNDYLKSRSGQIQVEEVRNHIQYGSYKQYIDKYGCMRSGREVIQHQIRTGNFITRWIPVTMTTPTININTLEKQLNVETSVSRPSKSLPISTGSPLFPIPEDGHVMEDYINSNNLFIKSFSV